MGNTPVEPDGASATAGAPSRASPRHWVAAALIGILGVAILVLGEGLGAGPAGLSERQLIEEYLNAWYRGHYDDAAALTAPQPLRTGPSEQVRRDEVAYQELMAVQVAVESRESLPPRTVRCDVTYASILNRSVDAPPATMEQQFGIDSGLISFVAGPYLEDPAMTASFAAFAELLFPSDYRAACAVEPGYQTPTCARFKLDHLEDWASWHRIEYG